MTLRRPATIHLVALLTAASLAGCAGQQTTRTGFLEAPAGATAAPLEADPQDAKARSYAAPAERLVGYRQFSIEPVAFRRGPAVPERPEPAVVDALAVGYRAALAEALVARGYAPAAPGSDEAGTLRVRAAITGFERVNPALNALTALAVFVPVTAGGAASEAEILDARTGERLAALAAHDNGNPLLGGPHNYVLEHGHARAALRRQARALVAKLPEAGR